MSFFVWSSESWMKPTIWERIYGYCYIENEAAAGMPIGVEGLAVVEVGFDEEGRFKLILLLD